jgi:hypothetical protein
MLADNAAPVSHLRAMAPRLSVEERRALVPGIMARDTNELETTLVIAGRQLGAAPLSAMQASPAYRSLGKLFENARNGADGKRTLENAMLGVALNRVALLLDAPGAAEMAAHAVSWGLSPADPKLDLLHLNAALKTETIP